MGGPLRLVVLWTALLLPTGLVAQPAAPSPDQVKAAYLQKFASFIEWPASAFADDRAPIVVYVAGSDTVADELTRLAAGRSVQRRPVQVKKLGQPSQIGPGHLLFIGHDAWKDADGWVAAARAQPIAIVTDAPRGLATGALLAFIEVDQRIRFEASVRAAEQQRLQLSSRLLSVAERVVGTGP